MNDSACALPSPGPIPPPVTPGGGDHCPIEAMHGLNYVGQTVATVLSELRARQVTVPQYRYTRAGEGQPDHAPAGRYVQGAIPWAPGQVLPIVSRTKSGS